MSSIVHALSDLVKSMLELVWSFFTTAGDLVQKTAQFALKFATEIIDLFVSFFRGLVDLAGGIVSFVLGKSQQQRARILHACATVADNITGNVLMLGVVAAAVFGFLQYQRSQGRQVTVGNKKLN
jgi:hypothetical protein